MLSAPRLAAVVSLASLLAASSAGAAEVPDVGGKTLLIDVTNTSIIDYHFNNRNDSGPAGTITSQNDDFYGEWLDRLNVQASWSRLRLGLRLDTALYYHTPNADSVAALVADQKLLIDEGAKKNGDAPGALPHRREQLRDRLLRGSAHAVPPHDLPDEALPRVHAARRRRDRR